MCKLTTRRSIWKETPIRWKRRFKHTLAKFKDEVWLLQLKMSRTEVGKEGKSNTFFPNHILESRMKSWSEEEEREFRSVLRRQVLISRHVDGVNDVRGAHENWTMHSIGLRVFAETGVESVEGYSSGREKGISLTLFMEMRNLEAELNVTNVATVRCAESC